MIEAEEEWQAKLVDLEEQLKATEDQLKKDRRLANEKLTEVANAKRTLQQKLESANKKNGLLNDLLDQYQRSSEVTKLFYLKKQYKIFIGFILYRQNTVHDLLKHNKR